MIRPPQLIKEMNCSRQDLFNFLASRGFRNPTINTPISEELVQEFKDYYKREIKSDFSELFKDNVVGVVKQQITHKGKPIINSHFSDDEAIVLCSKMSDGIIRSKAIQLKRTPSISESAALRYQLHYLAMKAYGFYGGNIITFLMKLRILPKRISGQVIKSSMKRFDTYDATFPNLSFQNESGGYYIRFERRNTRENNAAFTIYTRQHKRLFSISMQGAAIDNYENRPIIMTIFREIIDGKIMLFSGYDNTHCDICGRELTDAESVLYGRGPSCRSNYGQ